MQGRAEVVGPPHAQVEWEEPNKERSRHDDRVRCIVDGLGSIQPGTKDRRSMDKSRSPDAHQLPGAPSSNTCNTDICKTGQGSHNFAEVGQHISGSIYQQPGGYSLPEFSDLDQESIDVVPGEEHTHHSSASARDNELYSRHRVSYNERPHRLEVESSPIQENRRPSWTNQCPAYYSWRPDPYATATDAFLQDWSYKKGFANPPWCLIGRVLSQTLMQQAQVILLAPVWKTQPWYPLLLEMLMDYPRRVDPVQTRVVVGQMQPTMVPQLAVWPISGKGTEVKSFRRKLQHYSSNQQESRLIDLTTHSSESGIASVIEGVQIPFADL